MNPPSNTNETYVEIGRVGPPHGLAGFFLLSGRQDNLSVELDTVLLSPASAWKPLEFKIMKQKSSQRKSYLKLAGVDSPEGLLPFRGMGVWVERVLLQTSGSSHEVYVSELLGQQVCDRLGQDLGRVSQVFDFGAGPILEIERPILSAGDGQEKLMLPYHREFFPDPLIPGQKLRLDREGDDFGDLWEKKK